MEGVTDILFQDGDVLRLRRFVHRNLRQQQMYFDTLTNLILWLSNSLDTQANLTAFSGGTSFYDFKLRG